MELLTKFDFKDYDEFVLNHPFGSILQSSYWAKVKQDDWYPHFLLFKDNGEVVSASLLLERKTGKFTSLFYCPRGFVLDYNNEDLLKEVITLSKKYVKENKGFLLRFDPEIPLHIFDASKDLIKDNQSYFDLLSKYAHSTGLSKEMDSSTQPRFQMVVDLRNDVDLLSKVKSKKRRLVKESYLQARGFEIIEDTSLEGVKEFARLSRLTELRQGVALRNQHYFENMYETFKESGYIKLFFAKLDIDQLIAYNQTLENSTEEIERLTKYKEEHGNTVYTNGIICIYGTPMVQMFYGASDESFSKYKPGYALHFHGIKHAQENKYDYFNLGGVQGTLDDGLYRFKSEFEPDIYEYVGDFDIIINQALYKAFTKGLPMLKSIKRKVRNRG